MFVRRKRVGDDLDASTVKKQNVKSKCFEEVLECIEIGDDSSSDEYHTVPNTQSTSDDYTTAPNTQTETSTDLAEELNSGNNKNLSEFIVTSSPILRKHKLKHRSNLLVDNLSSENKENSSVAQDNYQYAKTACTAISCEASDTKNDVLIDRLLKSEESKELICDVKEIKEDSSLLALVTNSVSVAQMSSNAACEHETLELTRSAKR